MGGGGGGREEEGRLFEAGRFISFIGHQGGRLFDVSAYSTWALNRINTVFLLLKANMAASFSTTSFFPSVRESSTTKPICDVLRTKLTCVVRQVTTLNVENHSLGLPGVESCIEH